MHVTTHPSVVAKPQTVTVCLVTPALAAANNGNWQTAKRWTRMLSTHYRVQVTDQWRGEPCDVMLALHARRSAPSIRAFAAAHPGKALIVALTGTDLYRDIRVDGEAQHSLAIATRLMVLQDQARLDVPSAFQSKVDVCYQSTPARKPMAPPTDVSSLRCASC